MTIYSRAGCHLCEGMKQVVARAVEDLSEGELEGIQLEEIDISSDPDLEARYGLEIPVLLINGRKAAKYRVEETALRRMLREERDRPRTGR